MAVATISNSTELTDQFDIWGIDPLWHQPDAQGNDRVIFWVSYFSRLSKHAQIFTPLYIIPSAIYTSTAPPPHHLVDTNHL
jgi:hypothetical protein